MTIISLVASLLSLVIVFFVFYYLYTKLGALNRKVDSLKDVVKVDKFEKYRNIDGLLSTKHLKDVKKYGKR